MQMHELRTKLLTVVTPRQGEGRSGQAWGLKSCFCFYTTYASVLLFVVYM